MAEAWWGYFCFRCSRKASLFLSMSGGCMARMSRELRAPPTVCLRGTVRLEALGSTVAAGADEAEAGVWERDGVPFGEACLRLRCSASSGEVTFRLLLVCSVETGRDEEGQYTGSSTRPRCTTRSVRCVWRPSVCVCVCVCVCVFSVVLSVKALQDYDSLRPQHLPKWERLQ